MVPPPKLSSALARSSQATNTSGLKSSGSGASSPSANAACPFFVSQSAENNFNTKESAGDQSTGLRLPSKMASEASSDPLPFNTTLTSGCAAENSATAASIQSFFSVVAVKVRTKKGRGGGGGELGR